MSRAATRIASILFFTVSCPTWARAATLTIPATNATGVTSTPLAAGVLYEITIEGTYVHASAGHMADAEWHQLDPPPSAWEEAGAGQGPGEHDVLIDGLEYHWMGTANDVDFLVHTFSESTHVYKTYYLGAGQAITLSIQDAAYSDNSGSLTATIDLACPGSVPAVSEWGLIVMGLLILTVGTIVFIKRRPLTTA